MARVGERCCELLRAGLGLKGAGAWLAAGYGQAPGSLDASFGVGRSRALRPDVRAAAVQADGKVVLGGWFTQVNGAELGSHG